jgi:hypothetical protein
MDPTQPARPPTLSELMLPDACFPRDRHVVLGFAKHVER